MKVGDVLAVYTESLDCRPTRTVPLLRSLQLRDGGTLTLVTLEDWPSWFRLSIAIADFGSSPPEAQRGRVSDWFVGEMVFAPGIGAHTSQLDLSIPQASIQRVVVRLV